jgi:hypothetical protein
MTDKLSLYNGALRILRERPLASLSEASKARRALDADYDKCLAWCLEQDQWRHALVVARLDTPSATDPAPIGWDYAYELPADFARFYAASPDGAFAVPYNGYEIRNGRLYCGLPALYLKYVSREAGTDLTLFSASYVEFVECALAARNGGAITNNSELLQEIKKLDLKKALSKAKTVDAMSNPNRRFPPGTWVASRGGGMTGEGGNGGGGGNGFYSVGPDFAAYLAGLPTTPGAPGQPWNNGGVLSIS